MPATCAMWSMWSISDFSGGRGILAAHSLSTLSFNIVGHGLARMPLLPVGDTLYPWHIEHLREGVDPIVSSRCES